MQTRCGADPERSSPRVWTRAQAHDRLGCSLGRRGVQLVLHVVSWVLLALLADSVLAQEGGGPSREPRSEAPPEALAHYERGRKEYLAGRYREALIELKAALALDPSSPNLVYNVARVYEDLGELDRAIAFYRRYRVLLPQEESAERDKAATTIRRLEGARDELRQAELEQKKRAKPAPSAPAPAAHTSGNGRADAAFWLVAAGGVALAAGSGVTGWLALEREKQVRDFVLGKDGDFERREELRKQANQFALASDVLSVSAGVAILSAAVLFFTRSAEPEPASASLGATPLGDGLKLELRGRF